VGKIAKNSVKECVFFNSALKIQCHVVKNKNALAFSAILPTGLERTSETSDLMGNN